MKRPRCRIACFGKAVLGRSSQEYATAYELGALIARQGCGVVHGGYTGVMEAVSRGVGDALVELTPANLEAWDIAVPMTLFERAGVTISGAGRQKPAASLGERVDRMVGLSDACLVLATGGVGTLYELIHVIHLNQLAAKFGGDKIPIALYQLGNWLPLLETIDNTLDMSGQELISNGVTFVENQEQLKHWLATLPQENIK